MKKILTRVETNVGYETYRLLIESEDSIKSSGHYYYIMDAIIISVDVTQSNSSLSEGPFKKGFYEVLKFPIITTLISQQSLDYGDVNTKPEE